MQRYFTKNSDLSLEKNDIHHIKNVMRMKIGDEIEIVYDTCVYLCKLVNIEPLEISVIKELDENNELDVDITIAIGLVSEQKMDLILQKLTELGIKKIIPLKLERSIVRLDNNRVDKKILRWQNICKEASEQSHRNIIPEITRPIDLKQLVKIDYDIKLVASTKEKEKFINSYLQNNTKYAKIIIVIGPEGGITDNEEDYLNKNGFKSVTLGSRILRVETAAIYVASILNYQYMR